MKTVAIILFFNILFIQIRLSAQVAESNELISRPFQMTFLTPLGTNGLDAGKFKNDFSLNLIAGYNGGLSGFEVGGFANTIRYDMYGMQVAGFSNLVLGKTTGCQISGFSNINQKFFKGIQLSGFSNIVNDSAYIVQASGFSNIVKGKIKGTQVSGFVNISTGDAIVSQAAGFVNIVKGKVKCAQVSGFANISTDDAIVTQAAGFINVVNGKTQGAQVSGFANISSDDAKAIQIAGFANITSGTTQGVQVSGFFNYTKKLKGVQLGVFNYCDSVEKGIPIGVLSFVKDGYRAIDISADETLYLNASLHTGVKSFYNILSIGVKPIGNGFYWGYGYGIGSYFKLGKKSNLNIELSCTQINKDEWWTYSVNLLNKAKFNLLYKISDNIGLYGGISYNVFVTDQTNSEGEYIDSGIVPWSTYSKVHRNTLVKMYPGFNAGIRFF
jgi:hypothetical protein